MEKQNDRISKLKADKCLLQEQVKSLKHAKHQMKIARKNWNSMEVPVKADETCDGVLKYVKEMFGEDELNILDTFIDRAQSVPEYSDYKTKKKCKAIIARFIPFRHRTLLYRARKKVRDNVQIRLGLTKERHAILPEANNAIMMLSFVLWTLIFV